MGIEINSSGLGEILDKINSAAMDLSSLAPAALEAGAKPILEKAKQNIQSPVLHSRGEKEYLKPLIITKKLLESIKISKPSVKAKIKYINVLTKDPAAHLVEFGHSGSAPAPAHPFLMPAYQGMKMTAKDEMAKVLSEAIK